MHLASSITTGPCIGVFVQRRKAQRIAVCHRGRHHKYDLHIILVIVIIQETLETLRKLHRELEMEDAAEEPDEQVGALSLTV